MTYLENHEWNQEHYNKEAMRYGRQRAPIEPVEPLDLKLDQQVKFYNNRRWWTVVATEGDFVILTRQAEFGRGLRYTIISWSQGRRGPHDSYGHGVTTSEKIQETLQALLQGDIELSERHSIRLDIERVRDHV